MTKEEQKAKAVELIKYYYNKITNGGDILEVSIDWNKAKVLAIDKCQSIIDELELIIRNPEYVTFDVMDEFGMRQNTNDRITFYKGVIKAIEQQ